MDFTNFTNINARITAWGGIKQTAFNKKKYAAAEASWNLLSPQEIAMLDQQIPYGVEAFSFVATPTAILVYEAKTVRVIPIRDIMWIYGNVVKQTMNFIPTSKFHTLYLLARDGGTYSLGQITTGGFSKKAPLDEAVAQLQNLLFPYRKGIVYGYSDEAMIQVLYNAGAIGYLAMRNATVAGAVGGCQAEVGIASAMASSAAVELLGGTPEQCLNAASTVLMNMLGLVCDPVGGLVEYPCQNRNAAGVASALIAAEMSLSGIPQLIPFDEMLDTMYAVGRRLPAELRETALGGCATAPSACARCRHH